MIIKLD